MAVPLNVPNSSNFEFLGCDNMLASRWTPMLWRDMMLPTSGE